MIWIAKTTAAEKRGRLVHRAGLISEDGDVSARCYARPRQIRWPATWTIVDRQVNCPRCLKLMAEEESG
jgi:hypothetical protein